jgi:hypothetical protein
MGPDCNGGFGQFPEAVTTIYGVDPRSKRGNATTYTSENPIVADPPLVAVLAKMA